ncbi:hypothetical protein SUDANB121_00032 [Nocardiopsis dassonvillei]
MPVWTDQAVILRERGGEQLAVAVWTVGQTRAFLDSASGHWLCALFHLVVMTGLSRGRRWWGGAGPSTWPTGWER